MGGSDATERSERFVADLCAHRPVSRRVDSVEASAHTAADVDMLRICVSAEKLRDLLNEDDVFGAPRPPSRGGARVETASLRAHGCGMTS